MHICRLAREVPMPAKTAPRRRNRDNGRGRLLYFLLIELRISASENRHARRWRGPDIARKGNFRALDGNGRTNDEWLTKRSSVVHFTADRI